MNTDTEVLATLLNKQNQIIRRQTRIQIAILGVLLLFVITAGIVLFQVASVMNRINTKLESIDTDGLNRSIASLNEASDKFGQIDTEELNRLITSLNQSAEKMEQAVGVLSGLFS
jgi:predicted PurR-regulated permease PerM